MRTKLKAGEPRQMSKAEWSRHLFAKYAAKAKSVSDFLDRYYRRERYTGRGAEYASGLLASYEKDFSEEGICWISHHDSVTGDVVSFLGKGKAAA